MIGPFEYGFDRKLWENQPNPMVENDASKSNYNPAILHDIATVVDFIPALSPFLVVVSPRNQP